MKTYCRLRTPYAPDIENEYIDVPATVSGIKFAEWWKTASLADRYTVARSGDDYVKIWQKLAGDVVAESGPKADHDLKSVIKRLEESNEAQGDTSNMSEPPITNNQ